MITRKRNKVNTPDKTILVLGDSFAFGHGCSDRSYWVDEDGNEHGKKFDFRYPSEYCYASLIAKDNPTWRVINKGKPGLDSLSMFQDLLKCRKEIEHIDYVLVSLSFDDRILVRNPNLEEDKSKFLSWPRFGFLPKNEKDHIFGYPEPMVFRLASSDNEIPTIEQEHHEALKAYRNELFNPRVLNLASLSLVHAFYSICVTNDTQYNWSAPPNSSLSKTDMYDHISDTIRNSQVPGILTHLNYNNTPPFSKYRAPDGHANDLGHSKYYEDVLKPIMAHL